MELTEEQTQQLKQWVQEGRDLAIIQQALKEQFDISMTYMEVRFLVDDLDLTLQDKEPAPDAAQATQAPSPQPGTPPQETETELLDDGLGAAAGNVSVTVDKIQRPGAVVSGDVTFSDGNKAQWQVDQMGRLGLIPATEGYRPSPEDLEEFQIALQTELQKKGF